MGARSAPTVDRGLTFAAAAYDAVIDHARDGAPDEVCGILGGDRGVGERQVEAIRRATNASPTPERAYAIDPAEQLTLLEAVEAAGRDVVGFYHSHPSGPARPSATDAAEAAWSGYSYVVVALDGAYPFVGSWRWTGASFEPEIVGRR